MELFDHLLVLFGRVDVRYPERDNLEPAQFAPFFVEYIIERVGNLHRVSRQRTVSYPHARQLSERRLQRRLQLRLQLRVNLRAVKSVGDIAANVCVEQNRIDDLVRISAEASDRDVDVEPDVGVDDAERNRRRRTVFVAGNLFDVEIVNALVFTGRAAVSETPSDLLKDERNFFGQPRAVGEDRRFAPLIVSVLPGLGGKLGDFALVDDDGALPVVDDDR